MPLFGRKRKPKEDLVDEKSVPKRSVSEESHKSNAFPALPAVTQENLTQFISWLSNIVNTISKRKDVVYTMYDVPREQQLELDENIQQLIMFQNEAKASAQELVRINSQTSAIKWHKQCFNKQIQKLKAQEMKDMEYLVQSTCPVFYEKWQTIKKQRNKRADCLCLLDEIKEHQDTLEILATVINNHMETNSKKQTKPEKPRKPKPKVKKLEVISPEKKELVIKMIVEPRPRVYSESENETMVETDFDSHTDSQHLFPCSGLETFFTTASHSHSSRSF